MSGEASQRKSAGGSDGDPGTSWSGASADRAGQHGTRTGQELRGAVARVQCAEYESRESGRLESGTAIRTAAVAGGNRIAERADPRVQRTDRKAGAIKLSPGGAAKADQGSGDADRADFPADLGRPASLSQKPRRGLLPGTATGPEELRPQIADKVPTKLSFSTGALCFYGAC